MTCSQPDAQTAEDRRAYRAVFFDLDGTLLPMDTDTFMKAYLKTLGEFMAAHDIDANLGMKALFAGVKAMAENNGASTNAAVFWRVFEQLTGISAQQAEPLFMRYYEGPFNDIAALATPNPASAQAVRTLKEKGYRVAVTTMPMFPLQAVHARIRWAGLFPDDFEFVTDYETNTAIKPNPRFYEEALERIGLPADDVLMVGNHTREDGLATRVGLDFFLVTDCLLEGEGGVDASACKHGSMQDFARFCEGLPACGSTHEA